MLRCKKYNIIHNLINANNTDSKNLYKLITEVNGQISKNFVDNPTCQPCNNNPHWQFACLIQTHPEKSIHNSYNNTVPSLSTLCAPGFIYPVVRGF